MLHFVRLLVVVKNALGNFDSALPSFLFFKRTKHTSPGSSPTYFHHLLDGTWNNIWFSVSTDENEFPIWNKSVWLALWNVKEDLMKWTKGPHPFFSYLKERKKKYKKGKWGFDLEPLPTLNFIMRSQTRGCVCKLDECTAARRSWDSPKSMLWKWKRRERRRRRHTYLFEN